MKRSIRTSATTTALLIGLVGTAAHATAARAADRPNYTAYYQQPSARTSAPVAARQDRATRAIVTATDPLRGVPTFLWAPADAPVLPQAVAATPERAGRAYLERYARLYNLTPRALATAEVAQVHDTGRGGIIVVFRQKVDGIDVFHNELKVLMRRDRKLVAIAGNLHPSAVNGHGRGGPVNLSSTHAISAAFQDLYGLNLKPSDFADLKQERNGYRYFELSQAVSMASGLRLTIPIRVKQVWYPMPERLQAAYFMEVVAGQHDTTEADAYSYVIAADDGRVLSRQNLTLNAFDWRVWAETNGELTPLAGPQADFMPHPTGVPDGSQPAYIAPVLVNLNGFNTNPNNTYDPWLAMNALATTGNNVDAYADITSPNGFNNGDVRATTSGQMAFDYVYDTSAQPNASQTQRMASVAQLFYVNNWLHDWYYDSGFDEEAGNAQADNFNRGGLGGDPLLAEAQDSSGTNNANMNPLSDGASPRMQMYVWDGAGTQSLTALNMNMPTDVAAFGPQSFNLTDDLALVDDGTAPTSDACSTILNVAQVLGRVALIDRGTCTFAEKVQAAQTVGAVGVIIANNQANAGPMYMGGSGNINIPVLSVSMEDGALLKQGLQNGNVTVMMQRTAGPMRDGTIDNSIVAHEWGHYFHLRQVFGGNQALYAMSEGWGDFVAFHMLLQPNDDVEQALPMAVYATAALGDAYYGIRRAPYSHSFDFNGLTFRHIATGEPLPNNHPIQDFGDNAEVHNAGEVWAQMMVDAYVALIQLQVNGQPAHTFAEAKRLMGDYVVGGMKMAPVDPTFLEQRDGILAFAAASDQNDFLALASGFARRGAGTCAVSPPKDSTDFAGIVEDFDLAPNYEVSAVMLDDSVTPCDGDGILDSDEAGQVTVEILNSGAAPLTDAQATISTAAPGVTFPNGAQITFGTIDPFTTGTAVVQIALDGSVTQAQDITLNVALTSAETCNPQLSEVTLKRVHYDETPMSSATDDVESQNVSWEEDGSNPDVWSRALNAAGTTHVWKGIAFGSVSDTSIASPDLEVSPTDPFVISFTHRYRFEFSGGTAWDGGVIEVSTDGGTTWNDISMYGNPGYGDTITDQSGNPLANRQAFTNQSTGYPGTTLASIDLGNSLAGQTVKVRFRIGTDAAVGDDGWEIDDIAFAGIVNTPFPTLEDEDNNCGQGGGGQGGGGQGGNGQGGNGQGGNGQGGDGEGGSAGGPIVVNPDGCNCAVAGDSAPTSGRTGAALASLAAALGLLIRRRRQGRLS